MSSFSMFSNAEIIKVRECGREGERKTNLYASSRQSLDVHLVINRFSSVSFTGTLSSFININKQNHAESHSQ